MASLLKINIKIFQIFLKIYNIVIHLHITKNEILEYTNLFINLFLNYLKKTSFFREGVIIYTYFQTLLK
jgi:hypothetical protein